MFASVSPPKTQLGQDLLAVWFLLRDPKNWTKGVIARNRAGEAVPSYGPNAACWCLRGGVNRVSYNAQMDYRPRRSRLSEALAHGVGLMELFNDLPTTSHNDVLNLIIRAYDRAELNQS